MTSNYFSIEREGLCIDRVHIQQDDGTLAFEGVMNMSYDELRAYDGIDVFVAAVMDTTNEICDGDDEDTVITLIGNDDVFIWSMLIGAGESKDELKYSLIDWTKDGKKHRYEKEN